MAKEFWRFLLDIAASRNLMLALAAQDIKQRFETGYLGIVWALINPLAYIFLLWFVFEVGFRTVPIKDVPYVIWLIAGLVPWLFISEAAATATQSVLEKTYLVKKVRFRVSTLPIIKIISALFIHIGLLAIVFIVFIINGRYPSLHWLQLPYFLIAAFILVLGFSWLTASVVVFVGDVAQVVGILLQFGFWLTPVFWPFSMMPQELHWVLKLNPAFYIVEGYRGALLGMDWFWHHWLWGLYFWVFALLLFGIGAIVFKRLRPHFADVL